ncbi:MAG: N-acetyl-alpha-D-glucosaminyl L-malate synthase BshA [Planctomycetes bacterium]|nr:N-acetyl-alpha-D-glucosaminyl L-malate synthase BshA [Planctomycetota bacterium]
MNIGILCWPTSGGSGVVASELGAALATRGHRVHVFSYRQPFRMQPRSERFTFHPIRIPEYPLLEYPSYGMAAACALAEAARSFALDVIHAHYAYPHAVSAYLACRMLGARAPRTVTTLHGTDIALVGQDASFACLTRFGIRQSDAVTAVSEFLRGRTQSSLEAAADIRVIPNFVDTDHFKPGRHLHDVPIIVHVSNFRPVKRSADALRAFSLARRKRPARMLFVGDGPEAPAVKELARRLGVADDVQFGGEDRDIEGVLSQASVLLSTSEFEGFGLASLEAMACEVPVVATNAGGLPEVVADGQTGFLVPVGDVDAMAQRMLDLLDDSTLARRMGEAGRARAHDVFRPEVVVPRYEGLYDELLSSRREAAHA